MATAYKTPGVYIVEKNAFPPSIVAVATAVPAFVGYTEKAEYKGQPLTFKPFKVTSMSEFVAAFGGAAPVGFKINALPTTVQVAQVTALIDSSALADPAKKALKAGIASRKVLSTTDAASLKTVSDALPASLTDNDRAALATLVAPPPPSDDQKTRVLALVGPEDKADFQAAFDAGTALTPKLTASLKTVADALPAAATADAAAIAAFKVPDGPTAAQVTGIKALIDRATSLTAAEKTALSGALQPKKTLAADDANLPALAKLQAEMTAYNKDAALSAIGVFTPADGAVAGSLYPDPQFAVGDTAYYLTRATTNFRLHDSMLLFFQNGGGPCWIVSVGGYDDATIELGDEDKPALLAGIETLKDEQEPTMLVIPDAMSLDTAANCISLQQQMLMHCGEEMRNRFAILDIYNGYAELNGGLRPVENFRNALGVNNLAFGAAYYPWLNTTIVQELPRGYQTFIDAGDYAAGAAALIAVLRPTDPTALKLWQKPAIVVGNNDPVTLEQFIGAVPPAALSDDLQKEYDTLIASVTKSLTTGSAAFKSMVAVALRDLNTLPPAAAMAGRYTAVDNSRGVWKAPANVSLNSVVSPTVPISAYVQEDLNVTPMGKSINAIRSFIGEGVLVWGARTLDGNSQDWRYINVRRTMIFIEESCKLAAKQMVFEPNVEGTWLTIRAMISNFLTTVWRQGGLAGAVPEDAFVVLCGLGQTMTADDILEGYLRVTVLVAVSRPAEFIEITFQQQVQKS